MAEYKSRTMRMLEERRPGFHPLMSLADLATDDEVDLKIRVDCLKTLATYCEPQLKSIEVHGEVKHDFGVLRVIMDEDDEDNRPIKKEEVKPVQQNPLLSLPEAITLSEDDEENDGSVIELAMDKSQSGLPVFAFGQSNAYTGTME